MRRSLFFGSSVLAAIAASLCCILPIIAAVTGLATLGAAAGFQRFRPYFLAITGALFVVGAVLAYRDYRHGCEPGSACATKPVQRWNLSALAILGLLVVTLAGFPYYSHALTEMVSPSAQGRQLTGSTATASFLVPDMDCPACAVGLRAAFERLPGVGRATVDFNTRRATIIYNPTQQRPEAFAKLVADAGFHVKPLS